MSVQQTHATDDAQTEYDRDYPVVYLDDSDIKKAQNIARKRDESKSGRGYLVDGEDRYESHLTGVLGELAVARWYGVGDSLDTDAHSDGDDGIDLTIGGFAADVKTTKHDGNGRLLVDEDHINRGLTGDQKLVDAYYLCEVIERGVIGLVGWVPLSGLLGREPRVWPRDKSNYVVQRRELKPIHEKRGSANTDPVREATGFNPAVDV